MLTLIRVPCAGADRKSDVYWLVHFSVFSRLAEISSFLRHGFGFLFP
jgi:hypothetical protein